MEFAGHLPTKHFDLAQWQAMPVVPADREPWTWVGEGFHRDRIRGKPIVFYVAGYDSGEVSFAVRPIVRVKMGRRVVGEALRQWPEGYGPDVRRQKKAMARQLLNAGPWLSS